MGDVECRGTSRAHCAHSDTQAFSALLYETISLNKLSGSRVSRVTDSATRALSVSNQLPLITQDADSVSKVMLKAHMRASPSTKLVSLYLFDAIARHAQEIARRNGVGFDVGGPPATLAAHAAALLTLLHEPAAEVGIDSMRNAPPEQREKVRKVIDIWDRAGTFPPHILERIRVRGATTGQAVPSNAAPTSPPAHATSASLPPNILAFIQQVQQPGGGAGPTQAGSQARPPQAKPTQPQPSQVKPLQPPLPQTQLPPVQPPQARPPHAGAHAGAPSASNQESEADTPAQEDLRAFDQKSFDPTNSAHWERLSRLWKNTYQVRRVH